MSIFDRNTLSSVHINFLFGAGVNGCALPQLSGFTNTISTIEKLNYDISKGLEYGIDRISNEKDRKKVKSSFIKEFKGFLNKTDTPDFFRNHSIINLGCLLRKTYLLVQETQNRNPSMKQINVYSLNYDTVLERVLKKLGYMFNDVSASNTATKQVLMNVVGFDYKTKKYIPSFMISKLHGDIDNPIIPGREKYKDMLNENYFEVVFNMKEQLIRPNSILIIIGYSGHDNHINKILEDCISAGLKVFWYKYDINDFVPFEDSPQIVVREQDDQANKVDTTKLCFDDMEMAWEKRLEE